LLEGFSSSSFFITLAFSFIIIHDAIQIRKHHTVSQVGVGILIGLFMTFLIYMTLF
jgi:acid phosphatase family membrane protein YuiD